MAGSDFRVVVVVMGFFVGVNFLAVGAETRVTDDNGFRVVVVDDVVVTPPAVVDFVVVVVDAFVTVLDMGLYVYAEKNQ